MQFEIAGMEPLEDGQHRFAPLGWRLGYALSTVTTTVFPMTLAAVFVGLPWNILLGLGALIALVLGLHHAFRIALVIDAEGVTVANFWRVERIAWREVSAIELRDDVAPGGASIRCVAFVRRASGGPVCARATFSLGNRRRALQVLKPLSDKWGISFNIPADVLAPRGHT
jgi:hypothetical protein